MNKRMVLTTGAVAALVALAGCIEPPTAPIVAAATVTPPVPGGPAGSFGEGSHRILDDIQAGIYRTGGPTIADFPVCSWRLMKGDHIVASGSASGTVSIVVEPFYSTVESHECLEWRRER
jgi:hypothetical protein